MVEPDPRVFQIPLYCPPVDFGVAPSSIPENTSPHFNNAPPPKSSGLPISPLPVLSQYSFLFHQDLITWNISLAQMQEYVRSKTIMAAPWPNTDFPRTVLYWSSSNQFGCHELQYNATRILQEVQNMQQHNQHFMSYQSIYHELQQQVIQQIPTHATKDYLEPLPKPNRIHLTHLLAGLIYARTIGSLEEVTRTGFELLRPPIYFDPHNEDAIELLQNSFQANRERNENKRKRQADEESYKLGYSRPA